VQQGTSHPMEETPHVITFGFPTGLYHDVTMTHLGSCFQTAVVWSFLVTRFVLTFYCAFLVSSEGRAT
jgi:hypothetical protein